MSVESIMSKHVISVSMDDDLGKLKQVFDSRKFHHLLVVESGKLQGVISDRDLLKALSPHIGGLSESVKDTATLKKKAHQIMSRKPVTLSPDSSINDAIGIFLSGNISCIPVVNDENEPVGIVSWRDVLKLIHIEQ